MLGQRCLPALPGELVQLCQPISIVQVGVSCSEFGVCELLSRLFRVRVPCHCSSQVGQGGGTSCWKRSGDNLLAAVHHDVPVYARRGHAVTMRFPRDKICQPVLWDSVAFVPNGNVLLWQQCAV